MNTGKREDMGRVLSPSFHVPSPSTFLFFPLLFFGGGGGRAPCPSLATPLFSTTGHAAVMFCGEVRPATVKCCGGKKPTLS